MTQIDPDDGGAYLTDRAKKPSFAEKTRFSTALRGIRVFLAIAIAKRQHTLTFD